MKVMSLGKITLSILLSMDISIVSSFAYSNGAAVNCLVYNDKWSRTYTQRELLNYRDVNVNFMR